MLRADAKRNRYTVGVERCAAGRVAKVFGSDVVAEYEKALAMEAALADTPFGVPKVLSCDASSGRVEFEYLPDMFLLEELFEQLGDNRQFLRAMRLNDLAAKLLATIHEQLEVPNARPWNPPAFLLERLARAGYPWPTTEDVCLHCDYSPVNLMVSSVGELAVIDASPNAYFTQHACLKGHRLVDVASYTAKLFCPFHWRTYSMAWRKVAAKLRRRFIETYERSSSVTLDKRLLVSFEYAIARGFVEWKTKSRPIRWAGMGLSRFGLYDRNFL